MTGDTGKVAANVGETTYTLTVTGKNNDSGTVNKTWKIQPKSITDTSVSASITGGIETQPSSFCYNASEQTPTLTVTDNGIGSGAVTLVKDTDYTVVEGNGSTPKAKGAATYSITITGKGNYTGTKEGISWSIVKANVIATAQIGATVTINSGDDFSDVAVTYSGLISPDTAANYPSTGNHLPSSLPVLFLNDPGYSPDSAFQGAAPESQEVYSIDVSGISDQNYQFEIRNKPSTLKVNPKIYPFTQGAGSVYNRGNPAGLVFRCTGEFNSNGEQFLSASVKALDIPGSDYEELAKDSDYTAEEGSTIVTLLSSDLESKPDGNYELLLKYKHGFSEYCPFRISTPPPPDRGRLAAGSVRRPRDPFPGRDPAEDSAPPQRMTEIPGPPMFPAGSDFFAEDLSQFRKI